MTGRIVVDAPTTRPQPGGEQLGGGATLPAQLPNTQRLPTSEAWPQIAVRHVLFLHDIDLWLWNMETSAQMLARLFLLSCALFAVAQAGAHKMTIDWTKPFSDPSAREQSAKAIVKDGNVDV